MTFDDRAYAALSRSQRIAYWRRRLEGAAAAYRPVSLRERALLDLWRTLNRLEPRFSAVPADLLDLYFGLRDGLALLEARHVDLPFAPQPGDREAEALRVQPPVPEPGAAGWMAAFEHARRLDDDDSTPTRPAPGTARIVVDAGAGSRGADDRQSLVDLIALLEQGYLNTYGPAIDPTVEPASRPARLPREVGRGSSPAVDPTVEPASRPPAGLVAGASRALDQALRRWHAVPVRTGERPGTTAAAVDGGTVESPGAIAARPVPSSVLWLRHWLRLAAAERR